MGLAEGRPRGGQAFWSSTGAPSSPGCSSYSCLRPPPSRSPPPRTLRLLSPGNCAIYRHYTQQPSLPCLSSKIFQVVMRWVSSRESREDRWLAQGLRGGLRGVFCGLLYDFPALPEEKQNQLVSRGVPREADSEMELCTRDVYWGEVSRLGRGPRGKGRKQHWAEGGVGL